MTRELVYCGVQNSRSRNPHHSDSEMVAKSVASPLLTFHSTLHFYAYPVIASVATGKLPPTRTSKNWELYSTAQVLGSVLSDEDKSKWESCKQALTAFGFSSEDEDKIFGKAFGQIHSPYWGEERKNEVPEFEDLNAILSYLKDLGLTDDDVGKILKKFPEVLGCRLENEVKENVRILEREWGIEGKTLRNLILRNPRVLGYNIDCKGDCVAQCTRCWARF